jgi:hypothetical protein
MIHINNIRVDHNTNGFMDGRCELRFNHPSEGVMLNRAFKLGVDIGHAVQHAIDSVTANNIGYKLGDKLKCVNAEGQQTVKFNRIYTFSRMDGNKIVLKGLAGISFNANRFQKQIAVESKGVGEMFTAPVTGGFGAVQYGGTGGKTSFLADLRERVEGPKTTTTTSLPVRRQRKGRKLVP